MQLTQGVEARNMERPDQTQGRVSGELEQITLHLSDVEEMITMLGERLAPVLEPESPAPTEAKDVPAPSPMVSDLTSSLGRVNMRLSRMTVRLTELRQRVEL